MDQSLILLSQDPILLLQAAHFLHQDAHVVAELADLAEQAVLAARALRDVEHLQDLLVVV